MSADPVAPPSDGVFTVARRGYDPQQVDSHLRRLDAEIRILVADRDAAVDQSAQLQRELDEARLRSDRLRTQVRTMAARPSDVQGMSERMRTMLRLAEDEVADMLRRADAEVARRLGEVDGNADEVLAVAQREAVEVREAARADAEQTTATAARHRAETDAACAADRDALARERAEAEHAMTQAAAEAEHTRTRSWAASESRRAVVEEDFRIAMDQRRAEALTEMHAERARTAAWVQRSRDETTRQCRAELAEAEETARRIVASAQARVGELADLRGRIALQLRGTQAQLAETIAALAPGAEPQALPPAPDPAPAPITATATPIEPAPLVAPEPRTALEASSPVVVEPEPVTRPLPIAAPETVVLDAPEAVEHQAPPVDAPGADDLATDDLDADDRDDETPTDPGGMPSESIVPASASGNAPDGAVPGQAAPADGQAQRSTARRRRRRSSSGAPRS